jgi:hypothetical protein
MPTRYNEFLMQIALVANRLWESIKVVGNSLMIMVFSYSGFILDSLVKIAQKWKHLIGAN